MLEFTVLTSDESLALFLDLFGMGVIFPAGNLVRGNYMWLYY